MRMTFGKLRGNIGLLRCKPSARPGQIGGEIRPLGGQRLVFAVVHDNPNADASVNRLLQALQDEGIFEYTNFDPDFSSGCGERLKVDLPSPSSGNTAKEPGWNSLPGWSLL